MRPVSEVRQVIIDTYSIVGRNALDSIDRFLEADRLAAQDEKVREVKKELAKVPRYFATIPGHTKDDVMACVYEDILQMHSLQLPKPAPSPQVVKAAKAPTHLVWGGQTFREEQEARIAEVIQKAMDEEAPNGQ